MQAVIDAAIAKAALDFPRLVRGLVKSKLSKPTRFCRELKIEASETEWDTSCVGDERSFVRNWANEPQPFTSDDGKQVQTLLEHDATSVRLHFKADTGGRRTSYVFSEDTMTATFSVEADQLPNPLTWSFVYRRVQLP